MTIEQFADFVYRSSWSRPAGIRVGQYLFIQLQNEFMKIANAIDGTDCDPFYVDARVPAFLKRVLDFVEV